MTEKCLLKIIADDFTETEMPEYLDECYECDGLDTNCYCYYVEKNNVKPEVFGKRFKRYIPGTDWGIK